MVKGGGEIRERRCPGGHLNRAEVAFCTTCGVRLGPDAGLDARQDLEGKAGRQGRSVILASVAVLVLIAIAGVAFVLGRQSRDGSTASERSSSITTSARRAAPTTSETNSTTSASPSTSRPVTTSLAPATASEAARSAAVVYFTYGVTAKGYPSFETVIAPSARPSVDSMIIGPDYRNASCSQIVESIQEDPLPNPPTYGWDLRLRYECPDGPPTSSADGSPLPMTEDLYVEVTVAPSPSGGYWATQVQIVDNN